MHTVVNDDMSDEIPTLLVSSGKNELFTLNSGLKTVQKRLRGKFKTLQLKETITPERLAGAKIIFFVGPRGKFTAAEFDAMGKFMEGGGSILLTLGEGGESRHDTNINFFLDKYGIVVNNDAIVRSSFYKYFHPKEVVVSSGVLNREIDNAAGKRIPGKGSDASDMLTFLYPYGATLSVNKPSVPVLSSGTVSLPVNRPVCAFYEAKTGSGGRLVVLGSSHLLQDQYIDKEENFKVFDVLMQWLHNPDFKLNSIDAEDPEVSDYHFLPKTSAMAEELRSCMQEGDETPRDFTQLFERDLFNIDTDVVPDAVRAYEKLNVVHEPLQLINPEFETPLPPLQPAVFPPSFRELEPPSLDLFDLDDNFSSERVRLAQLTNKCNDDDLEYYIRECGEILGVTGKLDAENRTGKHILEHIFKQVVQFKKLNQEE